MSRRRRSPEEEHARRLERRQADAERHAAAWLLGALPDDARLREYVAALGGLYVVERQVHRFRREADAAWAVLHRARVELDAAVAGLEAWSALLEEHALAADAARDAWKRAEWDLANPRDHDAHVWAWYRRKYAEPRRG